MPSVWSDVSELMTKSRDANLLVAWDAGQIFCWKNFQADVARAMQVLAEKSVGRVVLYTESAYWFAVGMVATFQAKLSLVLLPNIQSFSLALLDEMDVLLSDTLIADAVSDCIDLRSCRASAQCAPTTFITLDAKQCRIEIYTSGSTGQPKKVCKSLANFETEVVVLEQLWGHLLADYRFVGSVSHQHVYGILFRVMWPLSAGRPFAARIIEYPEQMMRLKDSALALVSSPALLKRVHSEPELAHADIIFSSGGPLDESINLDVCKRWGVSILEVFGSTETGGVATRNRSVEKVWNLMPGVAASLLEDETLWIESPHVAEGMHGMSDHAVLLPGRQMQVLGRTDRIVKLEEKRISLTAVERRTCLLDSVSGAHAFILEGKRELLAIVVELNDIGKQKLLELGAATIKKQLRSWLVTEFEPVSLPRKIRFVDRLPTNSQGKFDKYALADLFMSINEPVKLPQVLGCEYGTNKVSLHILVPENCCWFDGHFDGAPILSGVAQIDWMMTLAATYLGMGDDFGGVEVLKFQQVIRPGEELHVDLEVKVDKQRLVFVIRGNVQCSSGRIVLVAKANQ